MEHAADTQDWAARFDIVEQIVRVQSTPYDHAVLSTFRHDTQNGPESTAFL